MVLSEIRAQSLMIVNLPYQTIHVNASAINSKSYNNTILSYFHMTANSGSFDDGICADMDIISYLHRIVIEISTIGFVRRSVQPSDKRLSYGRYSPHHTSLPNKAIATDRNYDSMTWSCPSKVSANNSITRDDSLSSENNILWTSDGSPS